MAAALLLLLAAAVYRDCPAQLLKEGTEIFAVDPGKVIELSYRAPGLRLIASRWEVGDRFSIVFWEKKRPGPAFCPAGPGFEAVLKQLTSLKLRRTLDPGRAAEFFKEKPLSTWDEVVIRDDSALEPFRAMILPVSGVADEALVHFHGSTYVVAFDAKVFQLIAAGCKSLAGSNPNK